CHPAPQEAGFRCQASFFRIFKGPLIQNECSRDFAIYLLRSGDGSATSPETSFTFRPGIMCKGCHETEHLLDSVLCARYKRECVQGEANAYAARIVFAGSHHFPGTPR